MTKPNKKQEEEQKGKALAVKKERHEYIIEKIASLEKNQGLCFPKNYNYQNAIQAAWLLLNGTEDKDNNKALAVCTPDSIANFMLHMVTQGLSVAKKQCYAIVYGNQLTLSRSYFGTLAVVQRLKGVENVYSEVIRKGQEFKIGFIDGVKFVEKHDITFESLDADIIGAYCVIKTDSGTHTEIMTMKQINTAWSASKTGQHVHKKYPDQMAMRTVINRACKKFVNTSDDSDLLVNAFNDTTENEYEEATPETEANHIIEDKANSKEFKAEYSVEQKEEVVDTETGEVQEGEGLETEF